LPEGQGKGLASALMNPMLEKCSRESIPVILETANPANVEIYRKKGFSLCNTVHSENICIFYMKR
jgi:predicted acetyltransferase